MSRSTRSFLIYLSYSLFFLLSCTVSLILLLFFPNTSLAQHLHLVIFCIFFYLLNILILILIWCVGSKMGLFKHLLSGICFLGWKFSGLIYLIFYTTKCSHSFNISLIYKPCDPFNVSNNVLKSVYLNYLSYSHVNLILCLLPYWSVKLLFGFFVQFSISTASFTSSQPSNLHY